MSRMFNHALAAALLLALAVALPAAAQEPSDPPETAAAEADWEAGDTASSEADDGSGETFASDSASQDVDPEDAIHDAAPEAADAEEEASDSKQLKRKLKSFLAGLLLPAVEKRLRKAAGDDDVASADNEGDAEQQP